MTAAPSKGEPVKLAEKKSLTLAAAQAVAAAAEAEAARGGFNMCIAVVDDGGNLVCFHRMDETQIGSIEIAVAKARCAVAFKRPTKAFEEAVAGGRNALLAMPGAVPIEGGVPLTVDGKVIGGVGVSGSRAPDDGKVALAGAAALG
jgi:uncharacterized protein GlcG (DUF336 family)